MSHALVPYEAPLASAAMVLSSPSRTFQLERGGSVTIRQDWVAKGAKTGRAVWDASFVLADYVDRHCSKWERNSSVLELGAGLGLVSIAASRCGISVGQVLATDGDESVLPALEKNVAAGGESVRVAHLDWADTTSIDAALPPCHPPPDVILASDVIFLGSQHVWRELLGMLTTLCRRRRRWYADDSQASPSPLSLL